MQHHETLEPGAYPQIPIMRGQVIFVDDLEGGDLLTYVQYSDIKLGDRIVAHWRGRDVSGKAIDENVPLDVTEFNFEDGRLQVPIGNVHLEALRGGEAFYSYEVLTPTSVHLGDPHGFARQRKQTTVTPADGGEREAPARVQRFFYQALPTLADSAEPAWPVQAREEKSLEGYESTPYQVIENRWYQDVQDPLTLGRLEQQVATFHDLKTTTGLAFVRPRVDKAPASTTTRFDYVLEDSAWLAQSVLKTSSTFIGFDNTSRAVNEEHSVLTGQVLLQRDDNDVEVRYRYDALQRLTEEILAPETEDEAFRRYTYGLAAGGEPAWQIEEDVQGVRFTTYTDGMGRAVEEWRAEPGTAQAPRAGQRPHDDGLQIYTARYNALGQKEQETVYDDCQAEDVEEGWQPLALTTRFEYDDWGQERVQIGPDNVRRVSEACPVA